VAAVLGVHVTRAQNEWCTSAAMRKCSGRIAVDSFRSLGDASDGICRPPSEVNYVVDPSEGSNCSSAIAAWGAPVIAGDVPSRVQFSTLQKLT
jgi:hypothetical protein